MICNALNIVIISIAMFKDWFLGSSSNVLKNPLTGSYVMLDDGAIIRFYRTMFAVQQILPLLNSTLSPMILVWRGSALRQKIEEVYNRVFAHV